MGSGSAECGHGAPIDSLLLFGGLGEFCDKRPARDLIDERDGALVTTGGGFGRDQVETMGLELPRRGSFRSGEDLPGQIRSGLVSRA